MYVSLSGYDLAIQKSLILGFPVLIYRIRNLNKIKFKNLYNVRTFKF